MSSLTTKKGMHTNIFRCMSLNLYGSFEHEAKCRKDVKKYLRKAKMSYDGDLYAYNDEEEKKVAKYVEAYKTFVAI